MNTTDFINSLCYRDQQRFLNVYNEYLKLNDYPSIMDDWIWYNSNSWYVYIALENWITICEAFNWIEFLITNFDNWEEYFFSTYEEAMKKQEELNK